MNDAVKALRPDVSDAVWEASQKRALRYLARYNATFEKSPGLDHCIKTVGSFLQDDLKKENK